MIYILMILLLLVVLLINPIRYFNSFISCTFLFRETPKHNHVNPAFLIDGFEYHLSCNYANDVK